MPRNLDLEGLNYTREEFLLEMAQLMRLKRAFEREDGTKKVEYKEVPDGKRFNTLMEKLEKYYGCGENDFQTRSVAKKAAYIFMPQYTEYLAILLSTLEDNPLNKKEEQRNASAYVEYYNQLLDNTGTYLSKGFRNRMEALPGYVNANMIVWWMEPFLNSLTHLLTTLTVLGNISLGDVMSELTRFLDRYNAELFERCIQEDDKGKFKWERKINSFLRTVYEENDDDILNQGVRDLVEAELVAENVSIDKVIADLMFCGLYDYREEEVCRLEREKRAEELEKAAEKINDKFKENDSKYELREAVRRIEENAYGIKRNWGEMARYTKRDVYREAYCEKYLSEKWLDENLFTEEIEVQKPDGYEMDRENGRLNVKYKEEKIKVSKSEKKRIDRESWKSFEDSWSEKKAYDENSVNDMENAYLEFCAYIKETKDFEGYKAVLDSLVGLLLQKL